jgi:hemerythrin superfamily protein
MRATELLKQQHREVEALFAQIESGEPNALGELASALAAHMVIEQEMFYPAAQDVDGDLILESFEEHSVAEFALKRALATDPDDESFEARVTVLKELFEHHVKEEESELFPRCERALEPEQLESLGTRMEARFKEVLGVGYGLALPASYDETTADRALARLYAA